MDGRFEGNTIYIDLEVSGLLKNSFVSVIPVILDTGCTTDLILTYTQAFPMGLTLVGIQDYTIADGSKVSFFECIGKVKFGNRTALASISIRPAGSPLMGVSLLRKMGYKLEIDFDKNKATLTESKLLKNKVNHKA